MDKTILLFIFSILFIYSCSNSKNKMAADNNNIPEKHQPIKNQKEKVTFEQLTFNENGSGTPDKNLLLKDKTSFEFTWKAAHQNMSPIPTIPTVDFTKENVIFLDFGQHSHGGIEYKIEDLEITGDTVWVSIQKPEMNHQMMVTTVMTRPFMFIKIDNTKLNHLQVK